MSWNEPPDKNPWGNKGNKGNAGDPPDIEDVIRNLKKSFGNIFGSKGSNAKNGSNGSSGSSGSGLGFLLVFLVIAAWLIFDSFYALKQQERGVVLRFGEHVADLQPGLNLRFPRPIEKVIKVDVGQVRTITHKAAMLTQDENIVDVEVSVQWQIHDPVNFLFNLYAPAATLKQVTESAVREVIGKSELDFVMTEGRSEIAQRQEVLMQEIMDLYQSGVFIEKVSMQSAKAPEEVKAAFDDAIKAREDKDRFVNQAEAYRNDIIPKARGGAARLREEASSYKVRVVTKAEGEADRFEQLLAEYQRAPEVTRQRIYIDAIESVFSNSGKILVDSKNSNSLMYLPIDKLLSADKRGNGRSSSQESGSETQPRNRDGSNQQTNNRNRGTR